MPELLDLNKRQRQSPVGVAVIFFQKLRVAINVFISIVVVQFGFKAQLSSAWFLGIVIFVLLLVLVIAFLTYQRFFFYVEEESFVVEKGLLRRDKITIAFDRIQSVHITENIVQRVLKVVGLKIDTAGSAAKELQIPALPKHYARSLQEYLIDKKEEKKVEENIPENDDIYEKSEVLDEATTVNNRMPLVKLSPLDVFKVGFTENHLKTGLALFAIINAYIWEYEEYLLDPFRPFLEERADYFLAEWIIIVPLAVIFFLVVSVLLSLIQSFLRYFGLQFFVDKKGVQLVSGLLKRAEYQIPVNKIQYIKWASNPLRKLIGLKTIVVKQAGSNEAGDRQSLRVPGSKEEQLQVVIDEFFPEMRQSEFQSFRAHNFFKVQLAIFFGLIPALGLLFLGLINPYLMITSVVWLFVAIPLCVKFGASMIMEFNKDILVLKRGWVFPKTIVLKMYKLQNIEINQNIFQKRRGTMHINFYTAAGNLRMWHLNEKLAFGLYNYLLYKVENNNRGWM